MTTVSAHAVLLDMDGTLVDSTGIVEAVWTAWSAIRGLDPEHVVRMVHGRQSRASIAALLPGISEERLLAEDAWLLEQELAGSGRAAAVPGAADLLAGLTEVPHALVTSAPEELARVRMSAAGLGMPALAITAEQVSASKPDPEGFLLAAARLGVDPSDCLVFEDSAAGIASARAAGMRVVGVGEAATTHAPDWVVMTLAAPAVDPESGIARFDLV